MIAKRLFRGRLIYNSSEEIIMIKAVIFDLDGVLVTTDELHYRAWKRLAVEMGITGFTREDNIKQRGVSRMKSLEILLEKTDKRYTDGEKLRLAERKNGYYRELLKTLTGNDVLEGAREFIAFLKARGIKTAVGSASANAPEILERTGLLPLFDTIVSGADVTESKPDPQVFLLAARRLGEPPEACIVIEDSNAGIEAAKRGGMYAAAVGAAAGNPDADISLSGNGYEELKKILCDM